MARTKGSANFSGTIEPLAGGALDARDVVQAKADLTANGSFPYPYIGMETYVVAENKKYRLIGADPTVLANWEEVGSGGGGTSDYADLTNKPQIAGVTLSGNKTLTDLGIQEELTAGDGIVIDDGEISTDNMTNADMAEVVTPLPSVSARLPILFDESGAERVVGWYKYADGTKKPVYEKSSITSNVSGTANTRIVEADDIEIILDSFFIGYRTIDSTWFGSFYLASTDYNQALAVVTSSHKGYLELHSKYSYTTVKAWMRYTKVTDTAS